MLNNEIPRRCGRNEVSYGRLDYSNSSPVIVRRRRRSLLGDRCGMGNRSHRVDPCGCCDRVSSKWVSRTTRFATLISPQSLRWGMRRGQDETCGTCHGINRRSVAPTFPNLAAPTAPYIECIAHGACNARGGNGSEQGPDARARCLSGIDLNGPMTAGLNARPLRLHRLTPLSDSPSTSNGRLTCSRMHQTPGGNTLITFDKLEKDPKWKIQSLATCRKMVRR
jgi:hypothetical protein